VSIYEKERIMKIIKNIFFGILIIMTPFALFGVFNSYNHIFHFLPTIRDACLREDFNPESYGSYAMYCDPIVANLSILYHVAMFGVLFLVIFIVCRHK